MSSEAPPIKTAISGQLSQKSVDSGFSDHSDSCRETQEVKSNIPPTNDLALTCLRFLLLTFPLHAGSVEKRSGARDPLKEGQATPRQQGLLLLGENQRSVV